MYMYIFQQQKDILLLFINKKNFFYSFLCKSSDLSMPVYQCYGTGVLSVCEDALPPRVILTDVLVTDTLA